MKWIESLKGRWKVETGWQVIVILIVFALTGSTVAYIMKPLLNLIFHPAEIPIWAKVTYYILILPIYNVLLLFYGFVFGQFSFFWSFEKRFFKRIFGNFNRQS